MTRRRILFSLVLFAALAEAKVHAQAPVSDPVGSASAPLFVADLPAGTITVRVTRQSMANPVNGANVVGTWTPKGGRPASQTVKTAADGRATFTKIPAGSSFQATTKVDGEDLVTSTFNVPDEGGTRLLLVWGAARGQASPEDGEDPHANMAKATVSALPGLRAGKVVPHEGTRAGLLEVRLFTADAKPIAGQLVRLGRADPASQGVEFLQNVSDASGTAHFHDLKTGEDTEYAAVVERDGLHVGTDAFTLSATEGAYGEIHMPGRTSDLSVLRISAASRMLVELREDALGIMQNLLVENTSDKVFDPGPQGLRIPLPGDAAGVEKLPGGTDVELKDGGAILHSSIPPTQTVASAPQVRVGYVLPLPGGSDFEIVHPMPLGMAGGFVMTPGEIPVTLAAPGLRARTPERDDNGNELRIYELDAIAPGSALRLTLQGIPTHASVGKWVALALVLALVAAGIVGARRSRQTLKLSPEQKAG